MSDGPEITPLTRIGELLEAYPELEQALIECAPAFRQLRNPILRRTVAKVATVQKAASIAGIDARVLVATLRRAAGQTADAPVGTDAASAGDEAGRWARPPAWIDASRVEVTLDADAMLAAGEVPAGPVLRAARRLGGGQVLRVTSAFRPVPLLELLEQQGFRAFLRQVGPERFEAFVCPPPGEPPADAGNRRRRR